jgi:hypothetical protein
MAIKIEIRRVFYENESFQVYGVRKIWRQLQREGFNQRWGSKALSVESRSARRSATKPRCPLDRINRLFRAPRPNML